MNQLKREGKGSSIAEFTPILGERGLWKIETGSRVHYFRGKMRAEVKAKHFNVDVQECSESEKCWYETKHRKCNHLGV